MLPEPEHLRHDSVAHYHQDSIWMHDSIYIHEYARGDTIYVDRVKEKWRDRIKVRTDTLKVTEYQTITETKKYVPRFYKICTTILILVIVFFLIRLAVRIVKAVYLRK